MKLHVVALAVAVGMAGSAFAAGARTRRTGGDRPKTTERKPEGNRSRSGAAAGTERNRNRNRMRNQDTRRDTQPVGGSMRGMRYVPGNRDRDPNYLRFNPPPLLSEIIPKVSDLIRHNRQEAAMLRALAGPARQAGFANIADVYEYMAADHTRAAERQTAFLTFYNRPVPADPGAGTVPGGPPPGTIDQVLAAHEQHLNHLLEQNRGERSHAVRGMRLSDASATAHHITLLRQLDADVDRYGRRALSARLQLHMMQPGANRDEILNRIIEEERVFFEADLNRALRSPLTPAPGGQPNQ